MVEAILFIVGCVGFLYLHLKHPVAQAINADTTHHIRQLKDCREHYGADMGSYLHGDG